MEKASLKIAGIDLISVIRKLTPTANIFCLIYFVETSIICKGSPWE